MYNQETTSTSSKNWIIVFVILIGLMLASVSIKAQKIAERTIFNPAATNDYIVESFNVKEVNNKLYFKFVVLENRNEINYTLESSSNGTDFYAVQLKEGFKSPNGTPLLYCYAVDLNTLNDNSYRIRRDSSDGVNYSSILETTNGANQENMSVRNN